MRPLVTLIAIPAVALAVSPDKDPVQVALRDGFNSTEPQVIKQSAEVLQQQIAAEPNNPELRRALGILLLDRLGQPEKALPHLTAAAELSPNDPAWHEALARALRQTGQAEAAVRHYGRVAELKPRDYWPRYEIGNTLSAAGAYERAIEAYRAALELAPKRSEVRLSLAKTQWAAGDIPAAQRTAREVLDLDQQNAEARALLVTAPTPPPAPLPPVMPVKPAVAPLDAAIAAAYQTKKAADFEKAAGLLEQELKAHPDRTRQREILVDIYQAHLHQPARALPHLQKLAKAKPKLWLGVVAKTQLQLGDKAAALATYQQVAELQRSDIWSRYEMGKLLRELKRPREAATAFRLALAIDPGNRYVRYELARTLEALGENRDAMDLARGLVRESNGDPLSQSLMGDIYRGSRHLADAEDHYRAALQRDPKDSSAQYGLEEIHKAHRPEAKLAFYEFEDTDDLRQIGVFSNVTAFLTGRLSASVSANARWFDTTGRETITRLETSASLNYEPRTGVLLSAGVSSFKTENLKDQLGGYAALYITPASCLDFWGSFRSADPVNDSYRAAELGLYQNVVAAGVNFRPWRNVQLSYQASNGDYSDGNTRRFSLATVSYYAPVKWSPVVRVDYQYLDFAHHTPDYSSPDNYTLLRPVLEVTPQLTTWLSLEFHAEADYVFDEQSWGYGLTVGPRVRIADTFNAGFSYMHYEIPGGQTNWSGDGFKVDMNVRF